MGSSLSTMSTTRKSNMFSAILSSMAMGYNHPKPESINIAQVIPLSAPTFPFKNATRSLKWIQQSTIYQTYNQHNSTGWTSRCEMTLTPRLFQQHWALQKTTKNMLLLLSTQTSLWCWFFIGKSQMVTSSKAWVIKKACSFCACFRMWHNISIIWKGKS